MSWAIAAEQYFEINISVTVDSAETAFGLGFHLVNQTYSQENQSTQ